MGRKIPVLAGNLQGLLEKTPPARAVSLEQGAGRKVIPFGYVADRFLQVPRFAAEFFVPR